MDKPHKKLDVWKKSIDLVEKVYQLTQSFLKSEEFGLTSQMKRSAVSIPANIAEGAARQTKKEFIQFLHVAQGSLSELDTHVEISFRLGFCKEDAARELSSQMTNIDKMLTGLIKSLRK